MGFYLSIFAILGCFSLLELSGLRRRDARIIFMVLSCVFFVLSFIRWETGTDWPAYYNYFNNVDGWFHEGPFEPGYAFINELAKHTSGSFTVMLMLCGAVLFAFQSSAILKYSPLPLMSLFFLWSVQLCNILFVRQWIAVAILFYSVRYIEERRPWTFLAMTVLACTFHLSALIFIPAWWIYKIRIKPGVMFALLLLFTALSPLTADALLYVSEITGGSAGEKIRTYINNSDATFGMQASRGFIIGKGFANKIAVLGAALILLPHVEKSHPAFRGYVNLYWFGAILYLCLISVSIAFARFSYMYDICQIIIVPYIFITLPSPGWKYAAFALLSLYLLIRLTLFLSTGYYDLMVPYKTIFSL